MRAASTILRAGTPVIRSTRSGQYEATTRRTASKPVVRAAMKSRSISPCWMATCSSPLASAASVPGVSCRCSEASLRGRGSARIDDDQPAAAAALLVEILHDRRHGLGRIAAGQQDRVRAAAISCERERQAAIEAEAPQVGGRR